jgi:hypothetical protein
MWYIVLLLEKIEIVLLLLIVEQVCCRTDFAIGNHGRML